MSEKKEIKVDIYSMLGTESCISTDDGSRIYEKIREILKNGFKAEISFDKIDLITSAFLNAAIGQLYNGEFDYDLLKSNLKATDISEVDKILLKKVVETAKLYFKDKDVFEQGISESLGEE